jgi:hypothetical protein
MAKPFKISCYRHHRPVDSALGVSNLNKIGQYLTQLTHLKNSRWPPLPSWNTIPTSGLGILQYAAVLDASICKI